MKKHFAIKLATIFACIVMPMISYPECLVFWGEPTPPMEKDA